MLILLKVKVQPGASCNKLQEFKEDILKIKLTALPVENKANQALKKFIASLLGLKKSQIEIVKGDKSRLKILKIDGISQKEYQDKIKWNLSLLQKTKVR